VNRLSAFFCRSFAAFLLPVFGDLQPASGLELKRVAQQQVTLTPGLSMDKGLRQIFPV
jgi:hypothetical protein